MLRGAGVAIGLPFLEQMVPRARAATGKPPLRFLAFFCPNGFVKDAWMPVGAGTTFTLGPTMEPLAPVKDDLLVITGIGKSGMGSSGCYRSAYGHDNGTGGMLTGGMGMVGDGKLEPGTVTIDQLIANKIG